MIMASIADYRESIGACRPGHTRALPGLFQIMHTHITRTGCKDTWSPAIAYACTDIRIAYSAVTKYDFRNCSSNAVLPSLAWVPTQLCRRLCREGI